MNSAYIAINKVARYFLYSFLLSLLLLFILYLQSANHDVTWISLLYTISIPAYYYIILLFFLLLLSPLLTIPYVKYLIIIPKVLFDFFLLADIFVFRIYRFHIDFMFINMLIHDYKGIGLSQSMLILAILAFMGIFYFNYRIFMKMDIKEYHSIKKINVSILFLLLIGQVIHIWGYEYNVDNITKFTPYFPYYLPTTSHGLMVKIQKQFPDYIPVPEERPENQIKGLLTNKPKDNGIFTYPKKKLEFEELENKPNVLIFLTESWRADFMTEKITPNIFKFSKSCNIFLNHRSTGNVTVSGLFGLFYGIHPSYLQYAQAKPFENRSILIKSFEENGYDIGVYTPSNLDRFSLKPMFFGNIDNVNYINKRELSSIENNNFVVNTLIEDIESDTLKQKPWFKFIFLDSSHHDYKYPKEHEVFLPVPENSEAFVFNKNIDAVPFINDDKNSLHYVDSQFARIYQSLIDNNLLENTLILVSSDHAEEFNDNKAGYWGHGSNFTKYQTMVPLLIKLPHQQKKKEFINATGHIDIVPTLLENILKVKNPIKDYSSGYNLLDSLPKNRGFLIRSYVDQAFIIDETVYVNGISFKSYFYDNLNKENKDFDYKTLSALRKEETYFLNH